MTKFNEERRIVGSRPRAIDRWQLLKRRTEHPDGADWRWRAYGHSNAKLPLNEREQFIEWFMKNDFAGATVDRINPSGDYNLQNLRLVSIKENNDLKNYASNRLCRKCHQRKDNTEFPRRPENKTGYATTCYDCITPLLSGVKSIAEALCTR